MALPALALGLLAISSLSQEAYANPPVDERADSSHDADERLQLAAIVPQAGGATPGDTSTVVDKKKKERPSPFGGAATVETAVGIGTFAPAPHDNALVSTTLLGSVFYRLSDEIRITAAGSLTWFNVNDFYTSLPQNQALLSDISIGISHANIYTDEASGLNINGGLRVLLPTSIPSQFQNRWFTLIPSIGASIPFGTFRLSYGFGFGKFFGGSAAPSVNCERWPNADECVEGRTQDPNLGFETERRGGEVFIPGMGANSFFFSNSLSLSWAPFDRFTVGVTFGIFNYFGFRSFPVDEQSSIYANPGRNQRDRLISSLAVSYRVLDRLTISSSLVTDTSQPFGARGEDLPVLFDLSRAGANITSITLALTGTF